ncbi:MAG: phosphate ABC transporter permease subunit PstC [Bacteroidales bacterium]|nr:phosphate ABC transporter permease subunit PstC [Bacteroidales bacterium]
MTLFGVAESCSTGKKKSDDGKHLKGEVSVSGAFALYPLAVKWANDFQIQNPGVRISVSAGGAGKGMTDVMNGMVNFGMLSRELHPEETEKGAVAFVVGRDAVVPTVNSGNPLLPVIMAKGITPEMAGKAWTSMDCKTWGELLGIDDKTPLHVYTRSDACGAAQTWASFFGAKQEDLKGTAIYGDPGIANAVENDIYGLGFNNIAYAYDPETHLPPNHLTIFPVDVNGDGTVESNEMFYRRKEDIVKAIETGRYPSPPSRNLYFVSEGIPKDSASVAFIRYILKEGQKLNIPAGYVKTPSKTVSEQMHFIKHAVRSSEKDMKSNNTNLSVVVFLGIIVLVLSFLLPSFFFKSWNRRRIYKEKASSVFMFLFTVCSFFLLIAIILGLLYKSVPLLEHNTLWGLLSSREWKPSKNIFGFLPFIAGSVYVTVISMIIAVPLSLFTAIYLTEYSKKMIKKIVFPSLDILAAMPSVVYGIWGILILIPIFGYSLMTASLVLCVMVLPILVSLFVEIFSTVPKDLKDASTSLGATRWQTTKHVVLKKSLPGILAAVVLALSKAVGETIAVMMVCGSIPKIPRSLMQGFYPLPALIGNNYGEMSSIPLYESAIMFAALILLVIVVIFNVLSRIILYRIQRNNE